MWVVVTSLGMLCGAVLFHWALWRWRVPTRTIPVLISIFTAGLIVLLSALAMHDTSQFLFDLVYATMIYVPWAIAYITTYTAIDSDSPTLSLVGEMARRTDRSMTEADLEAFIAARPFVQSRLQQLERGGLMIRENGMLRATGGSIFIVNVFDVYRRVIGRGTHGG